MHARDSILQLIKTALTFRGVTTGRSRVYPTDSAELPMILVYGRSEDTEWSGAVGSAERLLEVTIEVLVEAKDGEVDSKLNTHCEAIEDALNPQGSIAGVLWSRVTGTTFNWIHEGNLAIGIAELTVAVRYRTMTSDASALV